MMKKKYHLLFIVVLLGSCQPDPIPSNYKTFINLGGVPNGFVSLSIGDELFKIDSEATWKKLRANRDSIRIKTNSNDNNSRWFKTSYNGDTLVLKNRLEHYVLVDSAVLVNRLKQWQNRTNIAYRAMSRVGEIEDIRTLYFFENDSVLSVENGGVDIFLWEQTTLGKVEYFSGRGSGLNFNLFPTSIEGDRAEFDYVISDLNMGEFLSKGSMSLIPTPESNLTLFDKTYLNSENQNEIMKFDSQFMYLSEERISKYLAFDSCNCLVLLDSGGPKQVRILNDTIHYNSLYYILEKY